MTSEERHAARRARREAKRLKKKKLLNEKYGNFDEIISFDSLCESFYQCKRTVAWKASTQKYEKNLLENVYLTRQKLYAGESISRGFHCFTLNERGKLRDIKSIHISERVVQKPTSQKCLTPILGNSLIYDNGASLNGKGLKFAHERMTVHLGRAYKKYGRDCYILMIDFSKFFDRVVHKPLYDDLDNKIFDKRIVNLVKQFVDPFGETSLGLGSECNQILAVSYPNPIDHYVGEILGIGEYGRYMDDSYLIHGSKEYLKECLEKIAELCEKLGIVINKKKTQIIKLTHHFTFLKVKYFLTKTGKIVKQIARETVTRMRRKLKKFRKLLDAGLMTIEQIQCSYQSWRGLLLGRDSYNTAKSFEKLFNSLFTWDIMVYLIGRMNERLDKGYVGCNFCSFYNIDEYKGPRERRLLAA